MFLPVAGRRHHSTFVAQSEVPGVLLLPRDLPRVPRAINEELLCFLGGHGAGFVFSVSVHCRSLEDGDGEV